MTQMIERVEDDQREPTGSFEAAADPYRRELFAHCYRMLGSVHDAEDLLQETYLRAWRSYDRFEGRSTLRTWLYRIATNACLSALESRSRRPLPTGLGAPCSQPGEALVERGEVPWLEPVPDAMLGTDPSLAVDPAAVVATRAGVRLALVAALQHLPPRQRAVLVRREVLALRAAEVAQVLDMSVAAVNSSLQRARATLDAAQLREEDLHEPTDPAQRELLDRYAAALEAKDLATIVTVFTVDAVWEMPPFDSWYQGAGAIAELIGTHCPAGPGELRTVATAANGQPAFAVYLLVEGRWKPFQLQVLTLTGGRVSHVTAFFDTGLFPTFGLPATPPLTVP